MTQWLKNNRSFLIILLVFGLFRTALADWNPIPSESMHPTLLDGDVVLVNRIAYDLKLPLTDISLARVGEPRRGDVVTFHSPTDGVRLIKRLVGVPGDSVELRDDRLYVNGVVAEYEDLRAYREPRDYAGSTLAVKSAEIIDGSRREIQFLPEVQARRNFGPVVVPADSYFFLGDNRDDSGDSRYIGFVPRRLLIGRAHHVLVSADFKGNWMPRFKRFGERIL
ncbi:MAG TPA: signal peptidase I [Steroidobacteraceae bacterium]|jgi:signal peptidase I|nr:signal peptidase I [Steroidobacteraceae bacterium]